MRKSLIPRIRGGGGTPLANHGKVLSGYSTGWSRSAINRSGREATRNLAVWLDAHPIPVGIYSFTFRRRSALVITETLLKLIAAAAMMGLSSHPNLGYRMPAAIGTPIEL